MSTRTIVLIVVVSVLAVLTVGGGIVAAILVPTVSKVRETARRTVDASNLRQIVQASLIYATENPAGVLPQVRLDAEGNPGGSAPATVEAVQAALARDGGLPDRTLWQSMSDGAPAPAVAFDYATGISLSMPVNTPVAWTRGLREDGTWDPKAGVYGGDGGHIVFLGGNVSFFSDLKLMPLVRADGRPTSNILEMLPSSVRVVGSGPGSLHGREGKGPARSP